MLVKWYPGDLEGAEHADYQQNEFIGPQSPKGFGLDDAEWEDYLGWQSGRREGEPIAVVGGYLEIMLVPAARLGDRTFSHAYYTVDMVESSDPAAAGELQEWLKNKS